MAEHKAQLTAVEVPAEGDTPASLRLVFRRYVAFDIEPEEGQKHAVRHWEDLPIPKELQADAEALLVKLLAVDRKELARRAKRNSVMHEWHAHTLPAMVADGKVKLTADGKVVDESGKEVKPPKE